MAFPAGGRRRGHERFVGGDREFILRIVLAQPSRELGRVLVAADIPTFQAVIPVSTQGFHLGFFLGWDVEIGSIHGRSCWLVDFTPGRSRCRGYGHRVNGPALSGAHLREMPSISSPIPQRWVRYRETCDTPTTSWRSPRRSACPGAYRDMPASSGR